MVGCAKASPSPPPSSKYWSVRSYVSVIVGCAKASPSPPPSSKYWSVQSYVSVKVGCAKASPSPPPSSKYWSTLPLVSIIDKTGSPSRDGDVVVYVFDINQPSLPTPFLILFLCLFPSLWPFQLYFIP